MPSLSAERLKIISAPLRASVELGGMGAHISSQISIPKQVSGVSNNRLELIGTNWPHILTVSSCILSAELNQRIS